MWLSRKRVEAKGEYVCPYCISSFPIETAHRACTGTGCAKQYASRASREPGAKYVSADQQNEIDVERTVFLGRDPRGPKAVVSRRHIIRGGSEVCDICGKPAYIRLCPVCHSEIPAGAEEGGGRIFVILGPKGSGKSHYIAVLLDQLRNSVAGEFGAVFNPVGDSTTVSYREDYRKPLYEEGVKLRPTQPFSREGAREPLVYYLNGFCDTGALTVAFVDTAGEDLATAEKIMESNLGALISSASGIIYLVDPLQMRRVRQRIRTESALPDETDAAEILASICAVIRKGRSGLRPKDRIDIPLAVVLTKCDLLLRPSESDEEDEVLLPPGSAVRIPREPGVYDEENFAQIDAELEEYLSRTAGDALIQTVNGFEEHCCFAVSSLGSDPPGDELTRGVVPMRVEDPFIWLLNRKGMR